MTSRRTQSLGCGGSLAGGCKVLRCTPEFRSVRFSCMASSGYGSGICGASPQDRPPEFWLLLDPYRRDYLRAVRIMRPRPTIRFAAERSRSRSPVLKRSSRDLFRAAGSNAHPDRDLRLRLGLPVRNCAKRREWCASESAPECKPRTPGSDYPRQISCQPANSEGVTR